MSRMSDNDDGGGDDASSQLVHDVMDKMDDLGFGVGAVDSIGAALRSPAAWAKGEGLQRVVAQLLADLAAFAHGEMREANDDVQKELFKVLKAEGFPRRSLLAAGPSFLDSFDGRVAALDFLLSEVQAAKMLALAQHKKQQAEEAARHGEEGKPGASAAAAAAAAAVLVAASAAAGNAKKRGGAAGAEDSSDSSKRARGSAASSSAASAASSAAMEDVAAASSAPSSESDSASLSSELCLLAHTLHAVLPARCDGPAALRLLRARLQSWLGESPLHAQVTAAAPLFRMEEFSAKQLAVLRDIHSTFASDYSLRLRVLRKRLEVTLQSFMWGGKGVAAEADLSALAASKLSSFPPAAQVDEYEVWAATHTVLHIARMTSREYAQRSSIKRVIIGAVPDRGGRVDTNTRIGADYEMPTFQARRATSDRGGASGGTSGEGGHGRGGGGSGGGQRGGHRGGGGGGRRGGR